MEAFSLVSKGLLFRLEKENNKYISDIIFRVYIKFTIKHRFDFTKCVPNLFFCSKIYMFEVYFFFSVE